MILSLRRARRVTATALSAGLAAAGLLTAAACTPANTSSKVLSGTIQGADGKFVDAYVGFDVIDGAGHKIDLGAMNVGYSAVQRINHCVGTAGATSSQTCPTTGYVTTKNWSIKLPANAVTVYIEVYPKAPSSGNWANNVNGFTGVAAGSTNLSTYGETYRRAIPVPGNMFIPIVLPLICGLPGGSTGTLQGHINGWPAGVTGHMNAWSQAPNNLATQGFSAGSIIDGNGNYKIDKLQAGQRYGLIANGPGFSINQVNYANATTNRTLVNTCGTTRFDFSR